MTLPTYEEVEARNAALMSTRQATGQGGRCVPVLYPLPLNHLISPGTPETIPEEGELEKQEWLVSLVMLLGSGVTIPL